MVAKILGLAVGALVGVGAVAAFTAWRHVSDEEILIASLADHCLPYVETGAVPFSDMGRAIGVYDGVELDDALQDGSARLLFSNRFVAQWGVVPADGASPKPVRVCRVSPTYAVSDDLGFAVPDEGLIEKITAVVAPDGRLIADRDSVPNGPTTIGWFEPDTPVTDGLRVVIVAGGGLVSILVVANDIR